MNHIILFSLALVTLVSIIIPAVKASTSCYHCITTKPWAKEKCLKTSIQTGCSFCTKASFGNSLFVRLCAKSGSTNMYKDPNKMCKSYKDYFAGNKPSVNLLKKKWNANQRYYEQSCTATKNKEPKKGWTCTKKDCNAAPKPQSLSSSILLGVVAVFFAKSF